MAHTHTHQSAEHTYTSYIAHAVSFTGTHLYTHASHTQLPTHSVYLAPAQWKMWRSQSSASWLSRTCSGTSTRERYNVVSAATTAAADFGSTEHLHHFIASHPPRQQPVIQIPTIRPPCGKRSSRHGSFVRGVCSSARLREIHEERYKSNRSRSVNSAALLHQQRC